MSLKKPLQNLRLLAACVALVTSTHAAEIHFAGILGNSGEQGATLVKFSPTPAPGIGVVMDPEGALWDRAGRGVLNRYALDGRLLGTWKIEDITPSHQRDSLVLLDDTLILKQQKKLSTLPWQSDSSVSPKPLPLEVNLISFNHKDGWLAASLGREVFHFNLSGEKKPIATAQGDIYNLDIGPAHGTYVMQIKDGKPEVKRLDLPASSKESGPWPSPGNAMQWLNGSWYAHAGHGTIRRFDTEFQPDPGVVLGGNSGSFIGYVPENAELEIGQGLAHLGENLYAVSGKYGVLHLLEWEPLNQRFIILRRIGAVTSCKALSLDAEGRVWHHSGIWNWDSAPDTPLIHGVPTPDDGLIATVMTPEQQMIGIGFANKKGAAYTGPLDGPVRRFEIGEALPSDAVAATLITWNKIPALLVVNTKGEGVILNTDFQSRQNRRLAEHIKLQSNQPLENLRSLTSLDHNTVLATSNEFLIEFIFDEPSKTWKESNRWNQVSSDPIKFGINLHANFSEGRLWLSDTDSHRVLCLKRSDDQWQPISSFGHTTQSGDDLTHLNQPRTITANGDRAVVFDSANQRLVRLELKE